MRTILIPISNGFFARNGLRTEFLSTMKAASGARLVFLAPSEKLEYYRKEFASENVLFEEMPVNDKPRIEAFFKFLDISSLSTEFARLTHWYFFKRIGSQDPFITRFIIFATKRFLAHLGAFSAWRSFVRLGYGAVRSRACDDIFDRYKPDIVFCPTLVYGIEFIMVREAKRRGIVTIGMTSSWDNLYSKTFLRSQPDFMFVQTSVLKSQVIRLADYPADRTLVTGVPQYDRYFSREGIVSREEFMREIGGDPAKKTLLFAYSGKVSMMNDAAMLDLLRDAVRDGRIPAGTQIFIRPYPKHDFSPEKIAKVRDQYGFLVKPSAQKVGTGKDSWEFDRAALSFLANSLYHSDIVISTCSTFFIEAAIFDKPLVAVGYDERPNVDRWNSMRRCFEWDHFADIAPMGGVWVAKDREDFFRAINTYLAAPACKSEGRSEIVRQQCSFTDAKSSRRIAENILWIAGVPAART